MHTDPTGTKDADLPANTRVYMIASAPHGPGPFPPASNRGGGMVGRAVLNPLNYSSAVRALFRALDRWVVDDVAPPPSAYPQIADGTLTSPDRAGWPAVPGFALPQQPLRAFHLNFGPDWSKGIVSVEPPEVGKPFVVSVPAVDADGNVRAGIRLPDIAVPLATQAGWNYRDESTGAPDRLAGEIGSYIPFARTRADRDRARRSAPVDRGALQQPRRIRRQVRRRRIGPRQAGLPARGGRRRPVEARRRALRLGGGRQHDTTMNAETAEIAENENRQGLSADSASSAFNVRGHPSGNN